MRHPIRRRCSRPASTVVLATILGVAAACGGDTAGPDVTPPATSAPTTTSDRAAACATGQTGPLRVVLVNDDGVTNPAIDVLIDRLSRDGRTDLAVTVVAPEGERSGSADSTTPGGAAHRRASTPAGHPAYAVDGFPADAVVVALDRLRLDPHLVVAGINPGQNVGPLAARSGTVGAARTAIRRGVPALSVSAGLTFDEAQFAAGADLAATWIEERCGDLLARRLPTDTLASINLPACPPDRMGPLRVVPRARELPTLPPGETVFLSRCDLADPDPVDDIAAIRAGYPALSQVGPDL